MFDVSDKPLLDLTGENESFEIEMFDSVISEFNDIAGFPIEYYVLNVSATEDKIYGEDPSLSYSTPYRSKLLYDVTEENNILDVFGFTSDDSIQYGQMSKSIFDRDISSTFKPKIGDVIHTLWNNSKYEIVDVGAEQKIFQGRKMVWEFVMKPYRFSYESTSAQDIFENVPDSIDMPEINSMFDESFEAKTRSDNKIVDEISDTLSDDIDQTFYGYGD